jgi:hypothetical protein
MSQRLGIVLVLAGACSPFQPIPNRAPDERSFDNAPPVTSVDGEVVGVDRVSPADSLASGVHVTIRVEGKPEVVVDLAPDWYLEENGLVLGRADRVKIQGRTQKGSVLYATRLEKAGQQLQLRDPSGRPLWLDK